MQNLAGTGAAAAAGGFGGVGGVGGSGGAISAAGVTLAQRHDLPGGGQLGLKTRELATPGEVVPEHATEVTTGRAIDAGTPTFRSSALAGTCSGTVAESTGNVSSGTCPGTVAGDLGLAKSGSDAALWLPQAGSPVIDASPCVIATDARGVARPQGATCDAGAVELRITSLTAAAPFGSVALGATGPRQTLQVTAGDQPVTLCAQGPSGPAGAAGDPAAAVRRLLAKVKITRKRKGRRRIAGRLKGLPAARRQIVALVSRAPRTRRLVARAGGYELGSGSPACAECSQKHRAQPVCQHRCVR